MSVNLDLKGVTDGIVKLEAIANGTKGAAAKAINAALPKIRKSAVQKVNEEYLISKANVNKTMSTERARSASLSAFIKSKGRPTALTKFKVSPTRPTKQRGKTVKAQVKRSSGGGTIPNAFIARMKNGHVGAMFRKGPEPYPLGQFHGPAVPSMLKSTDISSFVGNAAHDELLRQIGTSFNELLGR